MYSIYKITGPSGKSYIGYTHQAVSSRVGQHFRHAERRATRHPFYDSIKKYGRAAFRYTVLKEVETIEEAKKQEVFFISEQKPAYNISPGGEDVATAHVRLAELMKDPVWFEKYRESLSRGCRNSQAHQVSWVRIKKEQEKFRKENPKEAYKIQRRASRCAKKKNIGKHTWNAGLKGCFRHCQESIEKMKTGKKQAFAKPSYHERVRRGVKKMWAEMSLEDREKRIKNVSIGVRKSNEKLTVEEKRVREEQLAAARKCINHEFRKERQKEAVKRHWTPERRAEKAEEMRKRHADV